MSITAVCLRRDGCTWEYIADYCQFLDADAARDCAVAAAKMTDGDLESLRLEEP